MPKVTGQWWSNDTKGYVDFHDMLVWGTSKSEHFLYKKILASDSEGGEIHEGSGKVHRCFTKWLFHFRTHSTSLSASSSSYSLFYCHFKQLDFKIIQATEIFSKLKGKKLNDTIIFKSFIRISCQRLSPQWGLNVLRKPVLENTTCNIFSIT